MGGIGGTLSWSDNRLPWKKQAGPVLVLDQEGWGGGILKWYGSLVTMHKRREKQVNERNRYLCVTPFPCGLGTQCLCTHVLFVPASGVPIAPVPAPPLSLILPLKQTLAHTFHQQSPLFIFFRGTKGKQKSLKQSSASFGTALLSLHPSFTTLLHQALHRVCLQSQLDIGLQQASS